MTVVRDEPRLTLSAMAAVLFAVSVVSAGYGIVLPILPLMLQAVDGPGATAEVARHTGLLTGTHALALFLFAPIWGSLSDRFGRRGILCICLAGFGASLLIPSLGLSIGMLYAERFSTGLFAAGITPVASALVADQGGSDEWRARRLAWVSMAAVSGFLLGPMLSGFLATLSEPRSYELPFYAVSAMALVAAATVRGTVTKAKSRSFAVEKSDATPEPNDQALTLTVIRSVGFLVAAGIGVFEVGLALRGNQELRMAPERVASMFTVCSLVMFIMQGVVFSPMFRPEWTRWLVSPGLAVMALSLLLVPFVARFAFLLVVVAAVAASAGILAPILTYWTTLLSGKTKGAELGKQAAFVNLGQAVGSVAGGSLFAFAFIPAAPFVVTAGFLALAALSTVWLPRRLERGRTTRRAADFASNSTAAINSF